MSPQILKSPSLSSSPYWDMIEHRQDRMATDIVHRFPKYIIDLLGNTPDRLMDHDAEDQDGWVEYSIRILIQGIRSRSAWMIESSTNPYLHINTLFPQFNRLNHIKQYGTSMQYVWDSGSVISIQDHDRSNHSYQVALSAERMGRALGLSDSEVHLLIYGGLLHDIATPGLGDITKLFFGIKSEETIFEPYIRASAEYLTRTNPRNPLRVTDIESYLMKTHKLSLHDIHTTIVGKWAIGEVLDIADRFTYTLEDTRMYFGHVLRDMAVEAARTPEEQAEIDDSPYTRDVAYDTRHAYGNHHYYNELAESIIRSDPHLSDIFEEIAWIDGRPVFTNPDRAIRILRLRGIMHHLVYFNPYNWSLEHYIGLMLKYLVDRGDLAMDTLLYDTWGENDIDDLARARGIYPPTFITNPDKNPFDTELFSHKESAEVRLWELQTEWRSVFLRKIPGFKSGLHYLAQWSDRQVSQLKELYPEVETELSNLSDNTTQYSLYVLRTHMGEFYDNCPEFFEFLNKQGSQKI